MKKRDVLTVFLASPSDLQAERKLAYEVVERLNKVLSRRVGWHIDLLGWEDTIPGFSRPQEIINKDVDSCDLFLGMLWRRWGQPTGEYSSGFHEEFTRARNRRSQSNSPEIWLFFKSVDKDSLEDPGGQLQKVMDFKAEQIERHELLFKEFSDEVQWRDTLYDNLLAHVLDIVAKEQEARTEERTGESPLIRIQEQEPIKEEAREGHEYPDEIQLVMQKANAQVTGQSEAELDYWETTRLFLLASTWFYSIHNDERLGVHEVNLVYCRRKSWTLAALESLLVLRTVIADAYSTRPGWYWFREWEKERIDGAIAWIGTTDSDDKVRAMAYALMRQGGLSPSRDVLEKGLADEKNEVVLEAIKLVDSTGLAEVLPLLDGLLSSTDPQVRNAAVGARLDLLYRQDPNAAFREYVEHGTDPPPPFKRALENLDLAVDDELLKNALTSSRTEVRRFAADYLRKTRKLDKDMLRTLLQDADVSVRRIALWAWVESGEKITGSQVRAMFPPEQPKTGRLWSAFFPSLSVGYTRNPLYDEFFPAILKQTPVTELVTLLDSYSSDNDVVYRFLAVNHFDTVASRIRSDLDSDFAALRNELQGKNWEPDTIDFVVGKMIAAALAGLAEHGSNSDVKYARRFVGNTEFRATDAAAVMLLARYGDGSDVERLLQAASTSDSGTQMAAFDAALNFSEDKIPILEAMLSKGNQAVADKAGQKLWNLSQDRLRQSAKAMLSDDATEKRVRGLALLVKFCGENELEGILDGYMDTSPRYYNVVTWLDRVLYAPGRYRASFKEELLHNLVD